MKIGPSNPEGGRIDGRAVGAERVVPARPGSGSDPVSANAPVEKVSVSLSGGRETLAGAPQGVPFDDAKVEALRRAIAEGRFPVDAKRVAEQLLGEARELLGLRTASR
jgi:negative regulator of flagellin synthesis FlgM